MIVGDATVMSGLYFIALETVMHQGECGVVETQIDMQGNAPPDSWRVMERFVSQANHFFPWGPPVYGEHPLSEELWAPGSPTASSIDASHSAATSSASHTGSRCACVFAITFSGSYFSNNSCHNLAYCCINGKQHTNVKGIVNECIAWLLKHARISSQWYKHARQYHGFFVKPDVVSIASSDWPTVHTGCSMQGPVGKESPSQKNSRVFTGWHSNRGAVIHIAG